MKTVLDGLVDPGGLVAVGREFRSKHSVLWGV
ncbi:unnamed protein product [Cuscuta epithymum]|uniref:Uncharacterized protein n=1 Tax=Cuscuta epithymum TaxID=186058 RepID=A0AAV0DV79_9ASTE|nr:unnamed protein product [Cuscuta epithymum]